MEQNNPLAYQKRPKVFSQVFVIVLCLAIGFGGGFSYNKYQAHGFDATVPQEVNLDTFWQVWNLIHENYVDKGSLKTEDLVNGAIDGMVGAIGDPHTVFFPPKESKAFAEQIKGAFGGVGIEIGNRDGLLTVIAPITDTPAARAGVLAGDKILKIDDKTTEGMSIEEAVSLIRGTVGTSVTLSIARGTSGTLKPYKLTRETIKIPAVKWEMVDGNVAHLEVLVFNQNVDQEFHKAAVEITKSGAKKIILDLRNNPGGLLDSAVNLAGYFQDEGQTVTIEREGNGSEHVFKSPRNGLLKNYPVVVVINKGSASASEILAGALRDNRNITVVGETSYGKGSVQDIFNLPKGASIKITFAKWFTPKGTSIDKNGIEPNIKVERSEEDFKNDKDPQLDKAREVIKNL